MVRTESRRAKSNKFKTDANMKIRNATPSDVDAIYQLVRDLAEYEKLLDRMVSTPDDFARELFGPSPVIEAIVAEVDGEIIGFALFFQNFSTFMGRRGLYLEDLFVKPEHRGGGTGKALLVRLAQIAVARNCARFDWSVLDWNAPSIAFYEAMGAQILPDWRTVRVTGDALSALANRK
jgi:GNAT superfamily N-acetyltransferase